MTIKVFVSAAVVSAIITLIGNIIAAKIAQKTALKTAQETTNQEIKKLEKTWEREDIISSEDEFSAMANAVARYIHRDTTTNASEAVGLVASVRSKEYGELGQILDTLYDALASRDTVRANDALTKAINKKREIRDRQQEKVSE